MGAGEALRKIWHRPQSRKVATLLALEIDEASAACRAGVEVSQESASRALRSAARGAVGASVRPATGPAITRTVEHAKYCERPIPHGQFWRGIADFSTSQRQSASALACGARPFVGERISATTPPRHRRGLERLAVPAAARPEPVALALQLNTLQTASRDAGSWCAAPNRHRGSCRDGDRTQAERRLASTRRYRSIRHSTTAWRSRRLRSAPPALRIFRGGGRRTVAATIICAAAATRKRGRQCGSSPVSVRLERGIFSAAEVQISASISWAFHVLLTAPLPSTQHFCPTRRVAMVPRPSHGGAVSLRQPIRAATSCSPRRSWGQARAAATWSASGMCSRPTRHQQHENGVRDFARSARGSAPI